MPTVVLADPSPLKEYYTAHGLPLGHLELCNRQEICRGAKIGKGYFLTTSDKWDGSDSITVNLFPNAVSLELKVVDSLELDYDHILLTTVEKKQALLDTVLLFDYNVIDQSALPDVKFFLKPADQSTSVVNTATAKTFQQIIDDILTASGYSANHAAADYPSFTPQNVFVAGRNVLDAIEYILAAIGRTFIVQGTSLIIQKPVAPSHEKTDSFEIGQASTPSLAVAFTVNKQFGDNQLIRQDYYVQKTNPNESSIGLSEAAYYPFLYQLRDNNDVVTNIATINSTFTWLVSSYNTTIKKATYIVPYYDATYTSKFFESVTFLDAGDKPLTIYEVSKLPRIPVPPVPPTSQSVNLFKYIQKSTFSAQRATADIYDPETNTLLKQSARTIIDPSGQLSAQAIDTVGVGVRVGERFYALGTTTSSGGGGTTADPFCGLIRFKILSVSDKNVELLDGTSVAMKVASAELLSKLCGCTTVPEANGTTIDEVFDPMLCHLSDEEAAALVGRQGTAAYMEPTNPPNRPGGDYDEGYNFRETLGYVTDEANETFVNAATLYPTFGWEDATNVYDEDTLNTVDRRLAGYAAPASVVSPDPENVVRFKVDLPEAGTYLISLAMGYAGSGGDGFNLNIKLYDGTLQFASFVNAVSIGQHVDAKGTVHTTAAWPDNHVKLSREFTGTEFIIEMEGPGSRLNHVRIESVTNCWWEITGLCCP